MSLLRDLCTYFLAATRIDQNDTFAVRKKFSFLPMLAAPADFQAELSQQGNQKAVYLYYSSTPCEDGSQPVSKCDLTFGESTDYGAGTDTILISQFTTKEYGLFTMNNDDYTNACNATGGEAGYKARIYANMKQRMYQAIEGVEKEAGLWVHNNAGYHPDGTHSYVGGNPLNATTKNLALVDATGRPVATSLINIQTQDIQNGFEGLNYKWVGDTAAVQAAAQYDTDFNANTAANGTNFVAAFLRKVFYSAYTTLFGEQGRGKIYKVAPGSAAILYYSQLDNAISMPILSNNGEVATDEVVMQRVEDVIAQVANSEDNLGDSTAAIQKTFIWRDPQTGALLDFIFTYKKCDGRWDIKGVMRITYHFWKNPKNVACSLVNGIEAYGVCNPVEEIVCPTIVPIETTQNCLDLGVITGCGLINVGDSVDVDGTTYVSPITMQIATTQDMVVFLSLLGIGAFNQNCGAFIYTPAFGQVLPASFTVVTSGSCATTFNVTIDLCAPCQEGCLVRQAYASAITATIQGNALVITPTFALTNLTIASYDWSASSDSGGFVFGATNLPTLSVTDVSTTDGTVIYRLDVTLSNGSIIKFKGRVVLLGGAITTYMLPVISRSGSNLVYDSVSNIVADNDFELQAPIGTVVYTTPAVVPNNTMVGTFAVAGGVNSTYKFESKDGEAEGYYNCEGGVSSDPKTKASQPRSIEKPATVKVATKAKK